MLEDVSDSKMWWWRSPFVLPHHQLGWWHGCFDFTSQVGADKAPFHIESYKEHLILTAEGRDHKFLKSRANRERTEISGVWYLPYFFFVKSLLNAVSKCEREETTCRGSTGTAVLTAVTEKWFVLDANFIFQTFLDLSLTVFWVYGVWSNSWMLVFESSHSKLWYCSESAKCYFSATGGKSEKCEGAYSKKPLHFTYFIIIPWVWQWLLGNDLT